MRLIKNKIFINIFSNWANLIIIIVIRFFLTPFLINKLGDEEYGIWILVLSIIGYMNLMNIGMNTAIIRYVAKYIELNDYKKTNEIFNTALCIFVSLALLILFLVLSLANVLPQFFNIQESYLYKVVFIIVGINVAFEFVFYTFEAVLSGKQKYLEINIIGTSIFIIRTGLVVIFLMAGYKLLAIALIQICTNIIRGILLSIYCRKITPELKFDFRSAKKESFKLMINYTAYNWLLNIAAKINLTGSILIIGYFLSAGAVTFYSIAINLITYLHTLIMQMQRVLIPRFSQLEAKNNIEKIQEHFLTLNRYSLIIAIPIIYIFIFYGSAFIELWIGIKYAHLSGQILTILAIGKIFHISQLSTETALKGISKHKTLSIIRIMESISILILSIWFVGKYELIGIAYANVISVIFFNLLVVPIYACNLLKISTIKYYLEYIFKNMLVIVPLFLIFNSINYPVNSYSSLGISILIVSLVSFLLSFILILSMKEKKMIYSLFRS